MHCLASHVYKMIIALWFWGISICDLKDNGTSLFFDVVKQVFWRIKNVEKEMDRLLLLDAVKQLKGRVAASNTSDVLSVNLEVVCVAAESQCVLPSDPAVKVSTTFCALVEVRIS